MNTIVSQEPNSNVRKVVVLGTDHGYQNGKKSPIDVAQFRQLLRSLCSDHSIRAIAEEMYQEALFGKGVKHSIPQEMATHLKLGHQYSDPPKAVRRKRKMLDECDIDLACQIENLTPAKCDALRRTEHAKREGYWMDQIVKLNIWPLLFICGANHTSFFSALLTKNGFDVDIAYEDWKAETTKA